MLLPLLTLFFLSSRRNLRFTLEVLLPPGLPTRTDYLYPRIMSATFCIVDTCSSGSLPVLSGVRFKSRFAFDSMHILYDFAITSAGCVLYHGCQNHVCIHGIGG